MTAARSMSHPLFPVTTPAGEAAPPPDDTAALTRALGRGDERAFATLHARTAFALHRRLLGYTRGDEALAAELTQASFLQLARRAPVCADQARLLGWLLRVARNAHLDACRRARREPIAWQEPSPDHATAPVDPILALLRAEIRTLPVDEAELLEAAYVDRIPFAELAARLDATPKAIERRLARLREKLRLTLLAHLRHDA